MQISIDNVTILTLTDTQKSIIQNDINADEFDADMQRRVEYIITHKIEGCLKRLKQEWVEGGKLRDNGVTSIPTDDMALAELIFSQPNYMDRKAQDATALAAQGG